MVNSSDLHARDSSAWSGIVTTRLMQAPPTIAFHRERCRPPPCSPSPLFEEKRNTVTLALSLEGLHPIFLHRSCSRSAFASTDDPINAIPVRRQIDAAQQWFSADERDVLGKSNICQVFRSLVKALLILG